MCSLSRCFVQTDARAAAGQVVRLHIDPGRPSASRVQGAVVRASAQRVIDDLQTRGLELHMTEVDARFFALYAELCRAVEPATGTRRSLPLLSKPPAKSRERRAATREPLDVPVRIFDDTVTLLGVTRDMSATGAYVVADLAAPVGASLHIELLLRRSFYAEGVVVRSGLGASPDHEDDSGERGFAIRFLTIEDMLTRATRDARTDTPRELSLTVGSAAELAALREAQRADKSLVVPDATPLPEGACVRVALHYAGAQGAARAPFYVRGRVLPVVEGNAGVRIEVLNAETTAAWLDRRLLGG
jgi:hypothetical protein